MISVDRILLPNNPLSNFEIINAVKKLRLPGFRGVFLRDNLLYNPRSRECGILNRDETSGTGRYPLGGMA